MTEDEIRQRSKAPEPQVMRRLAPVQPPREPRPTAAASRSWVQGRIADAVDATLKGVSEFVAGQRRLSEMRAAEAERRVADLERRVAELERRP